MELTGKAKEDFKKWFIETKDLYDSFENELRLMCDTRLNALIIEWFDSVEYDKISSLWDYCFYGFYRGLRDYTQATEQAIKKANDIYN